MCARPTLARRPKQNGGADLVPYTPRDSALRFLVPPTLTADFDNWLNTTVPGVNYTFEVLRNWYDRGKPDYQPV